MRRLLVLSAAVVLLVVAAVVSGNIPLPPMLQVAVENRNPWTSLQMNNAGDEFQFAIVSDRTGGHRAQDLLPGRRAAQPDAAGVRRLRRRPHRGLHRRPRQDRRPSGRSSSRYVNQLHMPFFYVPGNHDVSNTQDGRTVEGEVRPPLLPLRLSSNVLFLIL